MANDEEEFENQFQDLENDGDDSEFGTEAQASQFILMRTSGLNVPNGSLRNASSDNPFMTSIKMIFFASDSSRIYGSSHCDYQRSRSTMKRNIFSLFGNFQSSGDNNFGEILNGDKGFHSEHQGQGDRNKPQPEMKRIMGRDDSPLDTEHYLVEQSEKVETEHADETRNSEHQFNREKEEEVKSQGDVHVAKSSKVKQEISLHDDLPMAQMLQKKFDKTDTILKDIWSTKTTLTSEQHSEVTRSVTIVTEPKTTKEEITSAELSEQSKQNKENEGDEKRNDVTLQEFTNKGCDHNDITNGSLNDLQEIPSGPETFEADDRRVGQKTILNNANTLSANEVLKTGFRNSNMETTTTAIVNSEMLNNFSANNSIINLHSRRNLNDENLRQSNYHGYRRQTSAGDNNPIYRRQTSADGEYFSSLEEDSCPLSFTDFKNSTSDNTSSKSVTHGLPPSFGEITEDVRMPGDGETLQDNVTDELRYGYGMGYGYDDDDDYPGTDYAGNSSYENYGKFSSSFKGLKGAFQRMQKMMTGMKKFADESGFQICDVSNDGNCMFAAVVDQLILCGDFRYTTTSLRHAAVRYLSNNPRHEDGSHLSSFLDHESWEGYLTRMDRDSEWGDHLILTAIVEVVQRCITVYNVSPTNKSDTTLKPSKVHSDQSEILYLGHYGEEHFVSLRPKNWENIWYKKAEQRKLSKISDEQTTGNNITENSGIGLQTGNGVKMNYGKALEKDNGVARSADILHEKTGIDDVSGAPLPHLNYLIKALLHSNYIRNSKKNFSAKPTAFRTSNSKIEITGSVTEGLNYRLLDLSYYSRCSCLGTSYHKIPEDALMVYVFLDYRIKCSDEDGVGPYNFAMVTENVHPGYINIKVLGHGYNFGMSGMSVQFVRNQPMLEHLKTAIRGMDDSTEMSKHLVAGIECSDWLSVVPEWIQRKRSSNWPPGGIIQEVMDNGCLIVAKAHPNSATPDIEWKFLFSRAEGILAKKALTEAQKYCFSVFKVLIDCHTRELRVKLSVSHLKAVFYYACEVIFPSIWSQNPGGVLLYLIQKLLERLHEGFLPDYFIKENNLIDIFSRETTQLLEEKIEALRRYPIRSMLFIAQRHGMMCTSVLDSVIDDIERYRKDRDYSKTMQNVFMPNAIKLARQQSYGGCDYQKSYDIISQIYEEMLLFSEDGSSSENLPDFQDCLKNIVLSEKNETERFMYAFYLDCHCKTKLLDSVFEGAETKSLIDIAGDNLTDKYRQIKIPASLVGNLMLELKFLDSIAYMLYSSQEYEESAVFLRCGIARTKISLVEDSIDIGNIEDEEIKRDIGQQNFIRVQSLNTMLYNLLMHLYCSYCAMKQDELFFEYMEDLDELADRMGDSNTYSWVSQLWSYFGHVEKANEATKKMQMTLGNKQRQGQSLYLALM